MNDPIYKISGNERKKLKKELSILKLVHKDFFYHHQLDKDMVSFYGGSVDYPMSDYNAKNLYFDIGRKIRDIEILLVEKIKRK